jgi:hypothetical protein
LIILYVPTFQRKLKYFLGKDLPVKKKDEGKCKGATKKNWKWLVLEMLYLCIAQYSKLELYSGGGRYRILIPSKI